MSAVNDTFITVYKAAEHISTACCHGCGSILTEIEKLLHGKRWGGEFGEMFNMFGRTGQSGVFHDKPNELHYCSCFPRIPLAEPAPRLLWGMGGAAVEVDPTPANGKARMVEASRRRANGRSCGRDQWCFARPAQTGSSAHLLLCNVCKRSVRRKTTDYRNNVCLEWPGSNRNSVKKNKLI